VSDRHHKPAGWEPKEEVAPPYKFRYCAHHFWIPEYPRLLIAVRCPYCFPEGPANCDPAEYGDHVAFGYMATIIKAVKERGFVKHFGETHPTSFDAEEDAREGRTRVRPDAMYDTVAALRLHLLRKRDIITRRAEILGWNSPAMKAYIREMCLNHLIDTQLRKSEHHIQFGEQGLIAEAAEDDGGMGDDFEAIPPEMWTRLDGTRAPELLQLRPWSSDLSDFVSDGLAKHLANLPADERAALESRVLDGDRWKEIGTRLGIHPSAARRRVAAAIRKLRAALEPEKVCN
jgi:RNA polymerase sigma factor (sigma-70 family)